MFDASDDIAVTRIAAADAAEVLQRLRGTDRMERGAVFVISVEAIRDRLDERWAKRCPDVQIYLDRKLNENLSYQDIHQRVSETDVLVAMSSEEGVAAQAVGMKVLEEVLGHFLGEFDRRDIRLRAVTAIDADGLSCTELDPAAIAKAREEEAAGPYRGQVSAKAQKARNPISFVASNGQRVRVDFALEHVVSLRHAVTAVLRIEPTVSFAATGELIPARKFQRLSDDDMLAIDRATLAFGALFTPRDARVQPPLIVPISFRVMAGRKGREALSSIDGLSAERIRQGLLVEFVDIGRGTPGGRLVEVHSLVSRVTRGVLARLQPGLDAMDPLGAVRFNGLTVDFAEFQLNSEKLAAFLQVMARQMRGRAPALIAQGLPDFIYQDLADVAGFTHAGVRSQPLTATGRKSAAG